MDVPKPLRFEVDPKTVLKIMNVLYTYYLHRRIAVVSVHLVCCNKYYIIPQHEVCI